jgi:hypothetical protein
MAPLAAPPVRHPGSLGRDDDTPSMSRPFNRVPAIGRGPRRVLAMQVAVRVRAGTAGPPV